MIALTDQQKMAELWEERQIEKVMLRFGRALDVGDWEAYRACFIPELLIDFERLTGFPEVRVSADLWTKFAKAIQTPVRRHHAYSNFHTRIDGTRAEQTVYFTARVWRATDLGLNYYAQVGWYDISYIRSDGTWLMERLKHDFQWIEGNGALLDVSAPEIAEAMCAVFCPQHIEAAARYRGRTSPQTD